MFLVYIGRLHLWNHNAPFSFLQSRAQHLLRLNPSSPSLGQKRIFLVIGRAKSPIIIPFKVNSAPNAVKILTDLRESFKRHPMTVKTVLDKALHAFSPATEPTDGLAFDLGKILENLGAINLGKGKLNPCDPLPFYAALFPVGATNAISRVHVDGLRACLVRRTTFFQKKLPAISRELIVLLHRWSA